MEFFYSDQIIDQDGDTYYGYVCTVTSGDVSKAETSFLKYNDKKGPIYAKDPKKEPSFSHFCALFFSGGYDWDDAWQFTDFPYTIPSLFVCTNKTVAERLYKFLQPLEYHDTFNQRYMGVVLRGKEVLVYSGDY